MKHRIIRQIVVLGIFLAMVTSSQATLVGAGAGAMGASADGTGGRTNIDRTFTYLPAGTYNVDEFNFWGVNMNGSVQPFLSTAVAGPLYTPIWVGGAGGAVTGMNATPYAPGTQQFSLATPTRVYSGFGMTANAVGFNGGGSTDHNGAPALTPTVGVQLPAFSNAGLGRTYSSGIQVTDANPVSGGIIGPGSGISNASAQDTPGGDRLNIDLLFSTLAAGTYNVSDWALNVFDHNQGGTITPMLLTGTAGSYTTLWLGSALDPTSNGDQTIAESGMFTLAATTEVYAGFYTQGGGSGIIALDGSNAGNVSLTDHDTAFTPPAGIGAPVTAISNPGLPRTYAFDINVLAIPEPSAWSLLVLGGFALLVRRGR